MDGLKFIVILKELAIERAVSALYCHLIIIDIV